MNTKSKILNLVSMIPLGRKKYKRLKKLKQKGLKFIWVVDVILDAFNINLHYCSFNMFWAIVVPFCIYMLTLQFYSILR